MAIVAPGLADELISEIQAVTDPNRTGLMPIALFTELLQRLSQQQLSAVQVRQMLLETGTIEASGDQLRYMDFLHFLFVGDAETRVAEAPKTASHVLNDLDRDHDGKVTAEEARAALEQGMSKAEIAAALKEQARQKLQQHSDKVKSHSATEQQPCVRDVSQPRQLVRAASTPIASRGYGRKLGEGSDGIVYTLRGDGGSVIKVVKDSKKLKQAEVELNLHKALPRHPTIVQCFSGVVTSSQVTLSLERCTGDLWSAISAVPAPAGTFTMPDGSVENIKVLTRAQSVINALPSLALHREAWSLQCAAALEHLGGREVVHRDLNPFNIFLSPVGKDWLVKIGDFGVAALESDCQSGDVVSSNSLVQSEYSAPELSGPHGAAADIFSYGKVLLAMWHRDAGQPGCENEVGSAVSSGDVASANFEPRILALVQQCLLKDPSQRPSAEVVRQQLEEDPQREEVL